MKFLLCLFSAFLMTGTLSAQTGGSGATEQHPVSANERTTVQWLPDTLFFGEVYEGAILLDSFMVTNTGAYPYVIRQIKASCDCTVLRLPERPVMPGETAAIRVEFDSAGKAGPTRPGIVIYDNSKPNSRNILYLDGYVKPRKKPRNSQGGR